jgi:hypothetical protein
MTRGPNWESHDRLALRLNIWMPEELSHFMGSASFEHHGEDHPALRDVVVRIVSNYDYSALQRGIRYLDAVFYRLHERGMLTTIAVRPPSREDNSGLRGR